MFSFDNGQSFHHEIARSTPEPRSKPKSDRGAAFDWRFYSTATFARGSETSPSPTTPLTHKYFNAGLLMVATLVSALLVVALMPVFGLVAHHVGDIFDRATSPVALVSSENLEERKAAADSSYCETMEGRIDFDAPIMSEEASAKRRQYVDRCAHFAASR